MVRKFTLLILFCSISFLGYCGAVESFVTDTTTQNTDFGVCILDISTGNIVAQSGSDKYLSPASTTKLVTSVTALRLLGADYRYSTKVYIDGKVDRRGTLNGFVRIVGSGDPSIGSNEFPAQPNLIDQIVDALKSKGIKKINGNILTEESVFTKPSYPLSITLDDVACDYGAGAFGINFCDNVFAISINSAGRFAKINNTNPLVSIAFENNITICDSTKQDAMDSPILMRWIDTNIINAIGNVTQSQKIDTIYCSIPNPAKFLRDSLIVSLNNDGIKFNNVNVNIDNQSSTLLVDYQSPRLSEIIQSLLVRSDNMYADCVLRTIAVNAGLEGSLENGVSVLSEYWSSQGFDVKKLLMYDGSGLTRQTKMTANFLASILAEIHKNDDKNIKFYTLLPVAGVNGTVRSLLKGSEYAGTYALKSGSMSQVLCYAGYYPVDSPKYVVVVLTNYYSCTARQMKDAIQHFLIDLANEKKIN